LIEILIALPFAGFDEIWWKFESKKNFPGNKLPHFKQMNKKFLLDKRGSLLGNLVNWLVQFDWMTSSLSVGA